MRVKPSTFASGLMRSGNSALLETRETINGTLQTEKSKPAIPPRIPRSALSVKSCRIIRPRLAPSANRTEISFFRACARINIKFATFAHAMTSTSPTTTIRMFRGSE